MATASPDDITTLWCHAEGLTRVLYSPDAKRLFTGGSDSMLRAFELDPETGALGEPAPVDGHTDSIAALAAAGDFLLTACEDGCVRMFGLKDGEFRDLVVKANLAARAVAVERVRGKARRIAMTSDELVVKVVDAHDHLKVQLLTGHQKAVRAASWHPDGGILTTSGAEGAIRVWKASDSGEFTCIKTLEGIIAADEAESEYSVEAVWHPSGNFFVCAGRTHDIVIIDSDYQKIGTFSKDGHASDIAQLAWSPNGRYLASSGKDGQVIVWDGDTRSAVSRTKPDTLVTSISWSPLTNALAFIDTTGHVHRWSSPVPATAPHPAEGAILYSQEKGTGGEKEGEREPAAGRKRADSLGAQSEDLWGDLGGGDELDGYGLEEEEEAAYKRARRGREVGGISRATKGQPAFQPGATPLRMKRRYLAFNMRGVIHAVDQDTHNLVTVEFYDKSAHRGYSFQDHLKYSLGSLGPHGALYACPASGNAPSVVHYKPYDAWASQADWQVKLPSGESAVSLGAGGKGASLVATDRGFVRFFSGSGIQKYVWQLGGQCVAIAAGEEWAGVVWRERGVRVDEYENLRFELVDLESFDIIQSGHLPLPKGATLSWIGFSEGDDLPVIYDSMGLLSVLDRARRPLQARWVPALDTNTLDRRAGKDESYWAVGASATQMLCIILKGTEEHPYFPRPIIQELDLQMPLLNLDSAQGQLEEKVLRESIHVNHLRDSQPSSDYALADELRKAEFAVDKHLLQLVQTACKADKLERALDAARMLSHVQSLDAAIKIAAFFHLPALQDRIYLLKEECEAGGGPSASNKWDTTPTPLPPPGRAFAAPTNAASRAPVQPFAPRPSGVRRTFAPASLPPAPSAHRPTSSAITWDEPEPEEREPSFVPETQGASRRDEDALDDDDGEEPITFGDEDDVDEEEAAGAKRKRRAAEPAGEEYENESPEPKRRVASPEEMSSLSSSAPPPPKAAANPFAKRAAPTSGASAKSNNPFAKSSTSLKPKKSLHHSDSFFDRADQPQPGKKSTSKSKKSSLGPKQSTLFGLPAPPPPDKPKKAVGRPKKAASKATAAAVPEAAAATEEAPAGGEEQETETERETEQEQGGAEEDTQMEETQLEDPPAPAPAPAAPAADEPPELSARERLAKFALAKT